MTLRAISALEQPMGRTNSVAGLSIPGVVITELADTGGIICASAVDLGEVSDRVGAIVGCPLPLVHGATIRSSQVMAVWLTPRSWLLILSHSDETALIEKLAAAFPDHLVHGAAFSDYLSWFALTGAGAEDVLRQGSFLTFAKDGFPKGNAKRTNLAGISAIIIRCEDGSWQIGVERSRAVHFVKWLQSLTTSH